MTLARPTWMAAIPVAVLAVVTIAPSGLASAQTPKLAPATAPSSGRMTSPGEPGQALRVSGVVVAADGKPIAGASLYAYQTDAEGYYGVKPASDNQNPRLKLFLRSDANGAWSFDTIRPGSYPASQVPSHIHFEVSADGYAPRFFEIVFEGDRFVTAEMRKNDAFSVRPVENGRVTQRIVLTMRSVRASLRESVNP
jgi:protocatechuate 3,4-dioxygenase beta subunit